MKPAPPVTRIVFGVTAAEPSRPPRTRPGPRALRRRARSRLAKRSPHAQASALHASDSLRDPGPQFSRALARRRRADLLLWGDARHVVHPRLVHRQTVFVVHKTTNFSGGVLVRFVKWIETLKNHYNLEYLPPGSSRITPLSLSIIKIDCASYTASPVLITMSSTSKISSSAA